jgi:hypothetical protein
MVGYGVRRRRRAAPNHWQRVLVPLDMAAFRSSRTVEFPGDLQAVTFVSSPWKRAGGMSHME